MTPKYLLPKSQIGHFLEAIYRLQQRGGTKINLNKEQQKIKIKHKIIIVIKKYV